MPNKKINALDVRVASATDLMLVGDPTTGTAYKSTVSTLPLVPTSRTLTINGVAFDLSQNRAWTIDALPSQTGNAGKYLTTNGTAASWGTITQGTVTSVGLSMPSAFTVSSSPITSSGTIAVTGAGDTTQYIAGDGSLVTFPITGQAGTLVREVRNVTGATLTKGTVVYINGASGNKPTVTKAIATGDPTSAQTFGIIQADITNNSNGYVVAVGDLDGLNTNAFADGAQLYLSSTTAGTYTDVKQYAPNHLVYIGVVTRSHPTQGRIEIRIQNGYELDEIHNVSAQTPSNNDGLFYESSTSLWKNKSIATILGYTPQAALTLTTTGTSGAATLVGATLNIPQYSGGGGMAIGGAITSATTGSVLFAGASGVLQQDNANLFWDDTNNRLGIGTLSPSVGLELGKTTLGAEQLINSTLGTNIAPAIVSGNYTVNPDYTISGGVWTKSGVSGYTGASIGLSINAGSTYEFSISVTWTSGNPILIYLGSILVFSISASGTYTKKVTTLSNQQLIIPYSTGRLSFNAISIKLLSLGNLVVDRNLSVNGNFLAQNGTSSFSIKNDGIVNVYNKLLLAPLGWNNGDGANFMVNPTAKLEIIADSLYSANMIRFISNSEPNKYFTNFYHDASVFKIQQQVVGINYPNAFTIISGKVILNTTTDTGEQFQVNGTARVADNLRVTKGGNNYIDIVANANASSPYIDFFYSGTQGARLNSYAAIGGSFMIGSGYLLGDTSGNALDVKVKNLYTTNGIEIKGASSSALYLSSAADNRIQFFQPSIAYRGNIGVASGTSYIQIRTGQATNFSDGTLNTIFDEAGSVGIGGITSVVASARLQIDSTTKGFLPPRMTNAQRDAISSPAVGLVVYCTDAVEGLYVNKSTGWTFIM